MRIGINGRFLTRATTGVDRYAREVILELDKIVPSGQMAIAVPSNAKLVDPLNLKSIELVHVGNHSGHAWEQLDYSMWLQRDKRLGLSLCNTAPVVNPGVVCIHDMAVRANAANYSKPFVVWYRFLYALITRRSDLIVTVSDFSRRRIESYYPVSRGKISILPNAWQHMQRIKADMTFFDRHAEVVPDNYYFAMSSLAPNKNLRWLVDTARLNPSQTIVIAGGLNSKVFGEHGIPSAENVVYPGYVSDGEAKALMQRCKGFLFPTFYEGFGIPPMEALACGASIAVSDTEVMHEIYGEGSRYIDPLSPCNDLEGLFKRKTQSAESVLSRYGWGKTAEELLTVMDAVAQ